MASQIKTEIKQMKQLQAAFLQVAEHLKKQQAKEVAAEKKERLLLTRVCVSHYFEKLNLELAEAEGRVR
jgi:predicted solute-binding protein